MRTDGTRLALIAIFVATTALCCASLIDPTWTAGFYDNGDQDDVVMLITTMMGTPPPGIVTARDWQGARPLPAEPQKRIIPLEAPPGVNRAPPSSLPRIVDSGSRRVPREPFPATQRAPLVVTTSDRQAQAADTDLLVSSRRL